jgi:hypothetical protein
VYRRRKSAYDDHHSEINATIFKERFCNQFVNLLKDGAITVMDNASYNSVQINKLPTTASTKSEITEWMKAKNIPFPNSNTKVELMSKVRQHSCPKTHELDILEMSLATKSFVYHPTTANITRSN